VARALRRRAASTAQRDSRRPRIHGLPPLRGFDLAGIGWSNIVIKRPTCKQGHPMEAPNLIYRTVKGRHLRECRTCANAGMRRRREEARKKNGKPKSRKARTKVAKETKQAKPAEVDPMEFLEGEQPLRTALDETTQQVAVLPAEPADQVIDDAGLPSEADLDADAQERMIAAATSGFASSNEGEKREARPLPGVSIDTGDTVRHGPSGEEWVVAYVSGDHLVCCGWPQTSALLSDCILLEKATAEERSKRLAEMASISESDSRGDHARRTIENERVPTPASLAAHPAPTDAHGNAFDPKTRTVPAAVPQPPPRRVGCVHGFGNPSICPSCRAGG
jgi:hypothetical protein